MTLSSIGIALALVTTPPGLSALRPWILTSQDGLNTYHYAQTLTSQYNGTAEAFPAYNGGYEIFYMKQVAGDDRPEDGPPWATWLTPLSYSNGSVIYTWPSSSPYPIPPGKTYTYTVYFDIELGSQTWVSDDIAQIENERSRNWKNFVKTEETLK